MDRKITLMIFVIIATIALLLGVNLNSSAHADGKGDLTKEYNCGNSCHNVKSATGQISMDASDPEVMVGKELSIKVTVMATEQTSGQAIGVFLVMARSGTDSIPADSGWTIAEDPNGGINNYVEKPADGAGGGEFTWILEAPETPGEFTFYAREDHGNGDKYYLDFEEGIPITVIPDPDNMPEPDDSDPAGDGTEPVDGGDPSIDGRGNETDSTDDPGRLLEIVSEPDVIPIMLGFVIAGIIVMVTQLMRR